MSQKKEVVYSTDEEEKPVQRIRKPLSDEAKQQLRERLAKAREAKKAKRDKNSITPPASHIDKGILPLKPDSRVGADPTEEPVKRRGRTKKVVSDSRVGTDPTVEPKKRERKKKEIYEPEPEPEPEEVVELTKKTTRKKKEVVIVEPNSPPIPEPDKGRSPLNPSQGNAPLVEQVKPKRKYIRKPKITIPAFNPF